MPTEKGSDMDTGLGGGTYPNGDETPTDDGWCVSSGTSSATPQVAGLAALIKEQEHGINQGRFLHLVMTTCTDVVAYAGPEYTAEPGFDLATGAGLIDCYRAVKTMVQMSSSDIYQPMTLPQGNHVNFYSFSGPHGASYHIDTSGSTTYGYTFFGYLASRDGAFMTRQGGIRVTGWFRQYDTLYQYLWLGRRYLNLYVVSVDGQQILQTTRVLDENSGTDWVSVDVTITGLPERGMVRLAVGRYNAWSRDWDLTCEWAGVNVYSFDTWWAYTIPDGYQVHFGASLAPEAHMGATYRIDTIGTSQRLYYLVGESDLYHFFTAPTTVAIAGWFRQDDTFTPDLQQGRRYLDVYVVNPSDFSVVASCRILDYYDGTDWQYRRVSFYFTPPGWPVSGFGVYLIEIGRYDPWSTDWHLTGEWCNVQITVDIE